MLGVLLRQEVKVADKDATSKKGRRLGGCSVGRLAWWGCLLAVVIATAALRIWQIGAPPVATWDENHFLMFSQRYLNGTFFFDVHPPLGKMLVAGIGYLVGQNTSSPITPNETYVCPQDMWYIYMRLGMAVFGVLQVVTSFLTVHELGGSLSASYVTALLIICDCAANSFNRLVLLDPILLWFILISFYCSVKFASYSDRAFSRSWWGWMVATGVALGCTLSVKYVGVFVTLTVGAQAAGQLWHRYCDTTNSLFDVVKHALARSIGLILVPIIIYISTFYIHFSLFSKGASELGIGMFSAEFRLSFPDFEDLTRPAEVAYGSHVTMKPRQLRTGYLGTSYDMYPPDVGAEQQVVALDHNIDELNVWGFKRVDDEQFDSFESPGYVPRPVLHGNLVRLYNIFTERHLHTHRIWAPITPKTFQVTGYGDLGEPQHPGGVWRVLINSPEAEEGVTPLQAVSTSFRLQNNRTGCVLRAGSSRLPGWGFSMWEVVCDPKGVKLEALEQLWQIDENINPTMPSGDLKQQLQLSTLQRILELHNIMFFQNRQLRHTEFEGEGGAQKLFSTQAWMWPILYRGCPGILNHVHGLYFIGSPHVYLLNFLVLCLLPFLVISKRMQRARGTVHPGVARVQEGVGYLLLAWALHYLPFWTMNRVLYFHHYLPAFFFSTMITGLLVDGAISWMEGWAPALSRGLVRPSLLVALTAFYAHSYWQNWELAYGVPGDGSSQTHISNYLLLDSWLT